MKALLCKTLGPAEQLTVEDIPAEPMGPHAARVRVVAAGVNFPDTLVIEGKYQFKPALPFSPGAEMAGVVTEVGDKVQGLSPGDRVMAVLSHGCYREELVTPAAGLIKVPDDMPLDVAAVFPMAYGTSYHALVQRAQLAKGESVLVLGAAGGVGLAAVELAKALGAGKVIAAVGSDAKMDVCRAHGADEVINYSTGLKEQIKALTGGQGVDVIYDPVGGALFDEIPSCLAWKGRVLVVGFAAGDIPLLPINKLLIKGASAVGVFWGAFAMREPAVNAANFAHLAALWQQGALHPEVSADYALEQVPQALADLLARKAQGKLRVRISDG
ncbi:MAG: NADPH:quinone oxidoreductase family protein [Oceanococcaceae bacterium]